ncbi:glycoside hydrolase family 79 protein [Cenococcum geophilum 1.58]|uniref:glycoside hydrolase family 79 protein n=1 Tax=Cenococcum geophilum 1.58 TaxID=794803 RepID=UPI00358FDB2D|nr:glycoside hydrolase family 79 protein [Cenococcum geophilum 1.58]
MTLSASWFESFTLLEQVKWSLMVPLARKNLSNATEFANASLDYMADGFDALEIGNEPNLYPNANRPRAGTYPFLRARISGS